MTGRVDGVLTAPDDGTGDARRAVIVALDAESATGELPLKAFEDADFGTGRGLEGEEVSRCSDMTKRKSEQEVMIVRSD